MFKYVLKRLALMFFVFMVIITMCFFLVKLLPDQPPQASPGTDAYNTIMQKREHLGYNKPLIVQYGMFLTKSLFGGDWGVGERMYAGREVWDVFTTKLPSTMLVNV